ncbi:hypothetical protein DMENIID0001_145860 [Sergentomyia squamirostris]
MPIFPEKIKVAYEYVTTEIFIPSPFRCGICYKLGHTKKRCDSQKNKPTCGFCGEAAHPSEQQCLRAKCVNCQGDHPSFSKSCPRFLEEKEINAIRVTMRILYSLAREELARRKKIPQRPIVNYASSSLHSNVRPPLSYAKVVQSTEMAADLNLSSQ